MKMYLVNPEVMCSQHLEEEHRSIHVIGDMIKNNFDVEEFVDNKLFDLGQLKKRHDELEKEMEIRGCWNNNPLDIIVPKDHKYYNVIVNQRPMNNVDTYQNRKELLRHCSRCWERAASLFPDANWI